MPESQDSPSNASSFMNRVKEMAVIASGEVASGKPYQWLLLGTTAAGLAFEWGPGNEWLIGAVGASTHESFEPSTFAELVGTSTVAGIAAGAASAAEQTGLGLLMSGTVRTFPKTFEYWDETRQHEALGDTSQNKGDVVTGIMLGTSAVVIEKNAQDPSRTFKEDATMATKTAAAIGGFNAVLVTGVSIGVRLLEDAGFETASDALAEVAQNPLTYLGGFALYKTMQYAKLKNAEKRKS